MIELKNVIMKFRMANDRISSLKEYIVKKVTGQIQYKEFTALSNISFSIKKGEVVGIVGGNGAGKSTLLKIISGILTPTQGYAKCNGSIAPLLELGAGFDMDLTARENIFLNGAVLGHSKQFLLEKYDQIVEFAELHEFMEVPVRNFSSGMVARLAFSIATLVNPDVLIVDEILSVGDAHFQQKSANRMRTLINGGATVILVSHSISQIREICSKVIWLNRGKVMMVGPTEEVCDAYMSSIEIKEDEKESEIPTSINYEEYLYSPTAIAKYGKYYFIVDCWHHRVVYSKKLNDPLIEWNAVTGKFVNPHSIAWDEEVFLVEDTKNNKVKVLKQNDTTIEEVQVLNNVGSQPNKIVYDFKRKLFYGIAASSQQVFVLENSNGYIVNKKTVKIEELGTSYVRSICLIDDSLYLVSGPGKIIELSLADESFKVANVYEVPKDLLGMNEITKFGSYFYISSYQNADGDIVPKFVRVKRLEDLDEKAEDLYARLNLKGVPYGMSIIDERFFLTEIDSYSRILSFRLVNDEIEDVKIHFDIGVAHSASIFRRKFLANN